MGCDIHLVIQVLNRAGVWETRHNLLWSHDSELATAARTRNYHLFHILAGVRGSPFEELHAQLGIGELRGLPADMPVATAEDDEVTNELSGDDTHSVSWLTIAELNRYKWQQDGQVQLNAHTSFDSYSTWKFLGHAEPRGNMRDPKLLVTITEQEAARLYECCHYVKIEDARGDYTWIDCKLASVNINVPVSEITDNLFAQEQIAKWAAAFPPLPYEENEAAVEALVRSRAPADHSPEQLEVYVDLHYYIRPAQSCDDWCEKVMPVMRGLSRDGKGEDVRVVFGFDN